MIEFPSPPNTGQAEIVIAPQSSSVTAGSTVLFSCVAVGDPYPSITWIRDDGSEIMNDSMRISVYASQQDQGGLVFIHSILEICSVEAADAGYYTCVASNSLGSSNSSFQVDVVDESMFSYMYLFQQQLNFISLILKSLSSLPLSSKVLQRS